MAVIKNCVLPENNHRWDWKLLGVRGGDLKGQEIKEICEAQLEF